MSHLKVRLAAIAGSVALLALLDVSTEAEAARKKPAAYSQKQSSAVRSSYGYQAPRAFSIQPSGGYRRAPGTGILGGGPAAGSSGPP
jgi:hypothetical protein